MAKRTRQSLKSFTPSLSVEHIERWGKSEWALFVFNSGEIYSSFEPLQIFASFPEEYTLEGLRFEAVAGYSSGRPALNPGESATFRITVDLRDADGLEVNPAGLVKIELTYQFLNGFSRFELFLEELN